MITSISMKRVILGNNYVSKSLLCRSSVTGFALNILWWFRYVYTSVKFAFNTMKFFLSTMRFNKKHTGTQKLYNCIVTYFFLLNFLDWTENCSVVDFNFYCPNGDVNIGSVLAIAHFKGSDTFVNYHCIDYVSCKATHDGLRKTGIINWSQPLIFESIHERYVPEITKIIHEKGLTITKNDRCYQVWMPKVKADNILVELQSELYFLPLDSDHTEVVNKMWDYASPKSEIIVRETLIQNAGLGIMFRENNSFAGWAVEQHYGGIGMLHVLPDFRRRGYATELIKGMASRLAFKEVDPFALIEEHNNRSIMLFKKLQFEEICMVNWIGTCA